MYTASPCRSIRQRLAVTLLLAGVACEAAAVEVGPLRLVRENGKPLRAEISLADKTPVTATDLRVRIAARETFEVAGLRYHPGLQKVQIQPRQIQPGRVVLMVEGLPADTPKLDLLLTVSDRASLTIAEYRIDADSGHTEFPAARAGSSLAAQQRAGSAAAGESNKAADPPKTAEGPKPATVAAAASATPAPPAAANVALKEPASAPAADPRPQLATAVQAWAKAWSSKDVKAYVGSYAPGFVSADRSLSYEDWVEQRRERIEKRKQIDVRVEGLEFEPKGSDWIASFTQHYRGDGRRETSQKQLLLRQLDGRWLIIGEREVR